MPDRPQTRATIAADLAALGLRPGDTVLAHASLSSFGWVCGGAVAVVQALLDVLGSEGTLVVPAQTMGNSEPRHWTSPPVPEEWWPVIRKSMPAFDPRITPSWGIGAIGEMVRQWPGAVRSNHPHASFAAVGGAAGELMAEHRLDSHLGEHSPLAALERAGARVLLLGVGFNSCTAFHLAEYRVPAPRTEFGGAVLTESGDREWITYTDVATNSDDFTDLGETFENTGAVTKAQVGQAVTRLFDLDKAVAHAVAWLPQHRKLP
ncbi:MAG: aminoglycoside N(3)-acetyltransferase [Actinophytocola sp.]|uniref:aminoglycoside N(3)-acetyltransferase n=1 Tax=Actinophytocola sp. TaxID=1872138 RepID=UPI003D6C5E70